MDYFLEISTILLLILANGLLALSELAIVSSNRTKVETQSAHQKSAKIVLNLIDNPGTFLSTIQIGITIIGIISGAYSGQIFAEPLGAWLNHFSFINNHGTGIAFTIVVVIMTYISIVLGELIPKRLAINQPERIAYIVARPIFFLSKIMHPFVVILNVSTNCALKAMGMNNEKHQNSLTEDEIVSLMKKGLDEGAIDAFEHRTFQKILQFGNREASVIMTPRVKVIYLDLADSLEDNIKKILLHPHRYYPVFEGGLDQFKGIIDSKDALTHLMQGQSLDFKKMIKKVPCVIDDNLGPDLLDLFKKYKTHIAVVIDEYGTMQGIITLVDILETLVGTIPEIKTDKHYTMILRDDGSWLCDGLTPIDEIEDMFDWSFYQNNSDTDYNTLAGFLLNHLKHIPVEGESIQWQNYTFEIIDMDGNRIDKVLIYTN